MPELHTIENEFLRLTVNSYGAEMVSVIDKASGSEMIWSGDSAVWGRHAPILFPYTGRMFQGKFTAKGKEYPCVMHGFARDEEHTLISNSGDELRFELRDSESTLSKWPYHFILRTTYRLDGRTVHHSFEVENYCEDSLQFGIGYHPAFALPFDDKHTTSDYELVFDKMESPIYIDTQPTGLVRGKFAFFDHNITSIPLHDDLFDNDSFCFCNLLSSTMTLREKDTGRSVTCTIGDFPYVLIWSMPTKPMHFVCIEPWHSLPGEEDASIEWEDKPAAARLKTGESWSTTMSITFER